jgi:phosphatidylserine/phosphatidylglycerophosphate/cardiolipin synthase-like enzyme
MVTLLISSVLVLGLVAIAIYFWQKPAKTSQTINQPQELRGLFSDFRLNQLRTPAETPLPENAGKVDEETFEQAIEAIRAWQQSPNKNSTVKLLHVAALSDDAKNYRRAIELVLMSWRDGSLADLSAKDLQSLFNSEYWVLSSRTRISGAGFVLKRTLSNANRELESANNNPN